MVAKGTELVLILTTPPTSRCLGGNEGGTRHRAGRRKTATVALSPVEPNKLVGTLAQPLGTGARVVISATLADGHALQARFTNN